MAPIAEAVDAVYHKRLYSPDEAIALSRGPLFQAALAYRMVERWWDKDPEKGGRWLGKYYNLAMQASEWLEKGGLCLRLRRDLLSDNAYDRWEGYLGMLHNGPNGPYECFNHPPFTVNDDSESYQEDDTFVQDLILIPFPGPWNGDK